MVLTPTQLLLPSSGTSCKSLSTYLIGYNFRRFKERNFRRFYEKIRATEIITDENYNQQKDPNE